jgi:membrane associated rhomboid family serine protease
VIDGDMEQLRAIFLFVCFFIAVGALILSAFQAWSGRIGSASALGAIFLVCGLYLFLSQIKAFKVWQVEVELRETLDRA